jgi:phage tail-like protein
MPQGTSSGRFILEMDGVTAARASEVSGIGMKHEPFKIATGDRANPILGRSNYECEEVTVKHAYALNSTGNEMFSWFGDYVKGNRTDKLNIRLIQLAEDGYATAAIWELTECVPTMFSHENNKGDSNDAAYFTLKFKPTDADMIEG